MLKPTIELITVRRFVLEDFTSDLQTKLNEGYEIVKIYEMSRSDYMEENVYKAIVRKTSVSLVLNPEEKAPPVPEAIKAVLKTLGIKE